MKRILLSGGGTLGSVTPLLAVVELARQKNKSFEFFWVGTAKGPEQEVIASYNIPFTAIASGKLRRYFDYRTLVLPLTLIRGWREARQVLRRLRPAVVVSAGAYVSVPLFWAAGLERIPAALHEMDIKRGLANRLMAPAASLRTSVWPRPGARSIGNLVRPSILCGQREAARRELKIPEDASVVLVTGGGTGAAALNKLVSEAMSKLSNEVWLIHLTGPGKKISAGAWPHYRQAELVTEKMADYLAAADIVVTRAGMGILSELAVLKKIAVVIPMPDTHQEATADLLEQHQAAYILRQPSLGAENITQTIDMILADKNEASKKAAGLHNLIPDGTAAFLQLLEAI